MENQINVDNQNAQQVEQNHISQPTEIPEKPKVNYWILLLIAGLGFCLLVAIYYIFTLKNKPKDLSYNNSQTPKTNNQTSVPTPYISPTPNSTNTANFSKRQFAVIDKLFADKEYPIELTSIPESELIGMSCSKDYFSWSGSDFSSADPKTNEITKLSDTRLLVYLLKVETNHGKGNIHSIAYCDTEDGKTIIGYRAGPCGGGCVGIQYFSYADSSNNLSLIAKVLPQDEGAYYGCIPVELTQNKILYLKCVGEGTTSIQKLDLTTNTYAPVFSCRYIYTKDDKSDYTITCK